MSEFDLNSSRLCLEINLENLLEDVGRFVQRSLMKSLVIKKWCLLGSSGGSCHWLPTPPFGTGSNLSCWRSVLGNDGCCVLLEVAAGCQGCPCSVLSIPSSVTAPQRVPARVTDTAELASDRREMSWAGLGTHLCPMGHLQASLRERDRPCSWLGKALLVSLCQGWLNLVALSAAPAGQALAGIINQ